MRAAHGATTAFSLARTIATEPQIPIELQRGLNAIASSSTPAKDATQPVGLFVGASVANATTELPLRLSTYAFAGETKDKVRIAISAEIGRDRVSEDEVGIAFTIADASGRNVDSGLHRQTLMPVRAGEPGPLLYLGAISVAPGDYTLKIAAVDGRARARSRSVARGSPH
jgi:hypothetical protein